MRLASFNILHGRSLDDGQVDTQRLVDACASLEADVLALQEIDRNQARSGGVDQTAAVAAAMGAGAGQWRFEPALIGEPGARWRAAADDDGPASADARDAGLAGPAPGDAGLAGPAPGDAGLAGPEPGDAGLAGPAPGDAGLAGPAPGDAGLAGPAPGYGVGLVSMLPVRRWHVVRLRAANVRAPVAVPGGRGRFILLPDEPRVALAAEVDTAAGPLVVATTHLSFVPGWNLVQLRQVTAALARLGPPCVLLGDLNVPGRLPARVTGWHHLAAVKTFPGTGPAMQIDHALGHGPLPPVAAATARQMPLSDHRALVVDFAPPV